MPLERNANVLPLRVQRRVLVVLDVARLRGVDSVVATHAAVGAGEPVRAALAEDDVARYDILIWASKRIIKILI